MAVMGWTLTLKRAALFRLPTHTQPVLRNSFLDPAWCPSLFRSNSGLDLASEYFLGNPARGQNSEAQSLHYIECIYKIATPAHSKFDEEALPLPSSSLPPAFCVEEKRSNYPGDAPDQNQPSIIAPPGTGTTSAIRRAHRSGA